MINPKTNRLIQATSPYLLQHAHNPVDWQEWSDEAFEQAKNENKPVLVSIGYAACHWCHVMERESFENEDIASVMNEHFVCIKVDREERPDVDQVYMDAVQAMQIHGGWPLNVFLTEDQQPFYGGTYFPPKNWVQVLLQISKAYKERRTEINQSSSDLAAHLNISDLQRFAIEEGPFSKADSDAIFNALENKFDPKYGGIDKAPKFVMPSIWLWLLRYFRVSGNPSALKMVTHTLEQLSMGGIYDQLGGGFSRYSVDNRWFAPHFEKMLYDNAQLLSLYSETYRFNHHPEFKRVVYQTTDWLRREMMSSEGGFYSAIDADSESTEGKYYTWTGEELQSILGNSYADFAKTFNVTEAGNWEHGRNILYRTESGVPPKESQEHISLLLKTRDKRIRPSTDDKILLGWNAMMITGLVDAYRSFSEDQFLELALTNISFLEKNLITDNQCFRSFRLKRGDTEAFLEDYAFLIKAYLQLYQVTFHEKWIRKASRWTEYVIENFYDPSEGYFFFTSSRSEKLIAKKKEIFDNVIPSSNSAMAHNLMEMGIILDRSDWRDLALRMVSSLKKLIIAEPSHNSNWAILGIELTFPFAEIVITGKRASETRQQLARHDISFSVMMGTEETSNLPLLKDKPATERSTIYVCFNKACKLPVHTVDEALALLKTN